MTTNAAVAAVLSILGACCGIVAVGALLEQRAKAHRAAKRLDEPVIIDGGWLGEPPPDAPPPHDNEMGNVLRDIIGVANPGAVPIGLDPVWWTQGQAACAV